MENTISRRLRAGLIATSLSAALMVGGAAISASAQQQDGRAPAATPAQSMPGDNGAQQPAAAPQTTPDQDNGVRTAPDKDRDMQAKPADQDNNGMKSRSDVADQNTKAGKNELRREVKEFDT